MKKARIENLKNKFWFRLFIRVGIIFLAFVLLLTICNTAFLSSYYEYARKEELKAVSSSIKKTDSSNSLKITSIINELSEEKGLDIEIYNSSGRTYYSSGAQMRDYFLQGNNKLNMYHRQLNPYESYALADGSVMEKATDPFTEKEYIVYRFSLENDLLCEIRAQMSQIKNSASIANRFISIIAVIFLFIALVWVFWFSKSISKPISQMCGITHKMSELDFSQTLVSNSNDEIGMLADSINSLSNKLDKTLCELNQTNAQLRDEIELEHQLDVMRRGFVANVSHELKTPISIIQGYAEGLKLDINSDAREKYCDTIIDESYRMNKLVLSLLNLSKYESGQINLNITSFELTRLIKALAERIFANTNARVEYDMPESCFALADADQIEQIIKSYLENAASHVNENGNILISVKPNEDNGYTVSVYNSGSYVEEEQMPQIWQSFYRGDKSHNRDSGRFGLGLSIVIAIIKLHKQKCGVFNTDNGVCFWFTIQSDNKI